MEHSELNIFDRSNGRILQGPTMMDTLGNRLRQGLVIPACPLALNANRTWSERHQTALVRYYHAAGAGGLAVGVHSTQFQIRDPSIGLFKPVLQRVIEELNDLDAGLPDERRMIRIAGICGDTPQAIREAEMALQLGYDIGMISMTAFGQRADADALAHCKAVAERMPVMGFYLQPAVGGRIFPYSFWRQFAEIENGVAIKIPPFNRYQTLDVIRAVQEAVREDIALYTGNDDNIIADLITPFLLTTSVPSRKSVRFIDGRLLGQWGVWTKRAVEWMDEIREVRRQQSFDAVWLQRNAALTAANAAVFDAANGFAGCIPGIMEVLRRQGLVPSNACLNPNETLSAGQAKELDRIASTYPELLDDSFVKQHLDDWLR